MDFNVAVKRSIKSFLAGKMAMKTSELKENGLLYTPDFFDQMEEDLLEEPTDSKKAKEEELKDET
tara:strand:+ start:3916 stop:4110 length:195 start_codon:yes stop_codon:yes gene_type:complete